MKPKIALNLDIVSASPAQAKIYVDYYRAIQEAGGIPLLIPPMTNADLESVFAVVSGVVLIGGHDYSPALYGEEKSETVVLVDPIREEFDLRLAKKALACQDMPVLGICGGCQMLNIACGGTLVQDIATTHPDSKVLHRGVDGQRVKHDIILTEGSRLKGIYETEKVSVVASHHQAVKVVGGEFKVAAVAEDGVIEAIELPDRFVVGVQWHPERDFEINKSLFVEFVRLCTSGETEAETKQT